jgi:hypothetical protein
MAHPITQQLNEDSMNKEPKLPAPWPISFDEHNGVWSIGDNDGRSAFPVAQIKCRFDEHNGWRRFAAHVMANAERMYCYLIVMSGRGDDDAKALLDAIQMSMTANDAEERAMQSRSLNPR